MLRLSEAPNGRRSSANAWTAYTWLASIAPKTSTVARMISPKSTTKTAPAAPSVPEPPPNAPSTPAPRVEAYSSGQAMAKTSMLAKMPENIVNITL